MNTGATIPAIGFGTWQDKEEQEDAVVEALKVGVSFTIFMVTQRVRTSSNIATAVPPH